MKTLTKLLVSAVLASSAVSYAGPPPQFWLNRPAATPRPLKAQTASSDSPAESSGLTCSYMVLPNDGRGFSKSPVMTVRCTPQMMKSDWRCQRECAARAKG